MCLQDGNRESLILVFGEYSLKGEFEGFLQASPFTLRVVLYWGFCSAEDEILRINTSIKTAQRDESPKFLLTQPSSQRISDESRFDR